MNNIHPMNLTELDLNLLVVFDALMTERQVTRAGQKIGLSQPATSNALGRLRKLAQDDLFVRAEGELRPTPVALALAREIQPALQQISQALTRERTFDPVSSHRVFTIGMSDYTAFLLLPKLYQHMSIQAPQIDIQIKSGNRAKLLNLLDTGDADVICGVFPEHIPWHKTQKLFEEKFVCVCRQQHPMIGDHISLEEYVQAEHLLVSISEDRTGQIDTWLSQHSLNRRVALSVPHFLVAPFVLAETNLIATLAERVAQSFVRTQALKVLPLPLPRKGFSIAMRWHQSMNDDPAQRWLRTLLVEISSNLQNPK